MTEQKIKSLEDLGISSTILKKLQEVGITTLEALSVANAQELSQNLAIPLPTVQRLISQARAALGLSFKTALELKKERIGLPKITTSSSNLDSLLGGGIEVKTITELFGEFGSGKTQLCHQLAVNVQLPIEKGGLNKKAIYIDSEGTFRWERVEAMAKALGLNPDAVMEGILYIRAVNSDHQMAIIEELKEMIPKENIGLVIVDSITGHFRAEYPGRENLAIRQQKLNKHLHQLMSLAELYDVAVIITNQVMARPDIFYGDPTVAIGGHVLYHAPGIRVQLKKSRGNRRIARIVDAPHLPEIETVFVITEAGIRDPE
ncbi:MAG: DNA repair and recombination protein RadA [Ignisphaera sp.]|uniref:DNA repair and recombination protein RadA n=1 Tax=Ignisphaera aggregans TaxID=334771 RepID=A0A7J3MZE6_9CREN